MKAMLIEKNALVLREIPAPEWKPGYVVIDVHASGVNRADLLQVAGKYPPPPGWPEWPGLECSGIIAEAAPGSRWKIGDPVCALLGGGGYAEKVLVPEGMVMPVPEGISLTEAAALPEVYTTAMLNLCRLGELKPGETLFVQAGASGLGMAAIQLGKLLGAKVVTTVGSPAKADAVRKLGADVVIHRKTEAVEEILLQHPVDVALDCAGGALLGKCLHAVQPGGRWILVATLGGETTEIPLRILLKKHIRLMGSTLRSRSDAEKSEILQQLTQWVWPELSSGRIRPVIHGIFPLENAARAHDVLKNQENTGGAFDFGIALFVRQYARLTTVMAGSGTPGGGVPFFQEITCEQWSSLREFSLPGSSSLPFSPPGCGGLPPCRIRRFPGWPLPVQWPDVPRSMPSFCDMGGAPGGRRNISAREFLEHMDTISYFDCAYFAGRIKTPFSAAWVLWTAPARPAVCTPCIISWIAPTSCMIKSMTAMAAHQQITSRHGGTG